LGPLLDDWIEGYLFRPLPVALALAVGGALMIAVDRWRKPGSGGAPIEALTWRGALFIGLMQCLAMWPGTSRSLATMLAGLALGLAPAAAAEFSFLLALPTLGGATLYKLVGHGDAMLSAIGPLSALLGLLAALVSAAIAVRGLVAWLQRHGFTALGVYRLVIAAVVWWWWSGGGV
jgi:undecaprenyl-diphosphatase